LPPPQKNKLLKAEANILRHEISIASTGNESNRSGIWESLIVFPSSKFTLIFLRNQPRRPEAVISV
jgi:hypothetical protein